MLRLSNSFVSNQKTLLTEITCKCFDFIFKVQDMYTAYLIEHDPLPVKILYIQFSIMAYLTTISGEQSP